MIALSNVRKTFDNGAVVAVRDVSFSVKRGEIVVLLGTSGCGKTTTLKMINRLVEPTSGRIEIDDTDARDMPILELRRAIGYVFQDIGLFPHMTVAENAAITPRLLGWNKEKRLARAEELLDLVGIDPADYSDRHPVQLSGGQQQRVGIARALAADPSYLLMDEPFGALDAVTRDQLQQQLLDIRGELNKTILFVTHDLFEALRIGDRIGVMNAGHLLQIGPPDELINDPADDFVAELFDHARKQSALVQGIGS